MSNVPAGEVTERRSGEGQGNSRVLWAKSEPYHPLWKHLLDVGAVSLVLPNPLDRWGWSSSQVALITCLHDIGKAEAGFQHQLPAFSDHLKSAGFNPTQIARSRLSKHIGERRHEDQGERKSLTVRERIVYWCERKSDETGFEAKEVAVDRITGYEPQGGTAPKPRGAEQFNSIRIATDPEILRKAVRSDVGTQKTCAFTLLRLVLMRGEP